MAHVTEEQRDKLRRQLLARMAARGIEVPDRIAAQIAELLDGVLDDDLLALPQPQRLDAADENQRIVVTGMGAVTPFGVGVLPLWGGLIEGRSAIHFVDAEYAAPFPTRIGGEVLDFDARAFMDAKDARRMSRSSQFAVAAARMALDDARLIVDDGNRPDVGVLIGCGTTSMPEMEQAARALILKGGSRVSPLVMPMALPNMPASQVAIQLGLRGYTTTISTACAASTQAIGEAAAVIRRGDAEIMIAGGTEAPFGQLSLACFSALRALSTRNDDPERASRPFDVGRDGFVPAEAGAALVLERLSSARRRGAPIYAELLGYATTCDAFHVTAPDPDGRGAARAISRALANARITPQQVDYINAHATSTTVGDIAETKAIKQVFDEYAYSVPVSAPKSMLGHATGAAGAVEAVATILALKHGIIPPTINLDQPDPACDLDYVPHVARRADIRIAISNSFAFGGVNAVLVFAKPHAS